MLIRLDQDEIAVARYLFKDIESIHLNVLSFFEGNSPGKLYVDNRLKPTKALLFTTYWNFFLVGDYEDSKFNSTLKELVHSQFALKFSNRSFRVQCSENLEKSLEVIFSNLKKSKYCLYTLNTPLIEHPTEYLAKNYKIEFIDDSIINTSNLENLEIITNWINSMWKSIEDYMKRGFGYCTLFQSKKVISLLLWE